MANMIAQDQKSMELLKLADKAAKSHATVLITGETGVGKEVLARYIHDNSSYAHGPFVSVNCAALPENMIEAILFGYEKGSFTNAINTYAGKFEQADNGTILLDEISEIPLELQAKLLRVLQEREVEKIGAKKPIAINIRIIAATNRDLHNQVNTGLFRKDLFYRLNVLPLNCPPLRERQKDIIPIAEYFIEKYAVQANREIPTLSDSAKEKLLASRWPGNIRELENIVQRSIAMLDGDVINEDDIFIYEDMFLNEDTNIVMNVDFGSKLEEIEAKLIIDALKESAGCRNTAAKKLNISPRTLRYKIAKLRSIGVNVP